MSTTSRVLHATPEQVWEVLADGWLYPLFVVGASRMREVDETWPAVGARLHHSVGTWPVLLDDDTEVQVSEPASLLRLRAHGWPAGSAVVELRLRPGRTGGTEVEISEHVVSGPGLLVPRPVRDLQLTWRNRETLQRLAFVVEGRVAS